VSNLANTNEVVKIDKIDVDEGADYHSCPISTEEIQLLLQRMVLACRVMPTMCGAALCGMGLKPILDCITKYQYN
jgi:hypothetical protein